MNFPVQQAVQGPDRVGQSTAVEQSRAVAEVQAAIYVARQFPRDVGRSRSAMQAACGSLALANKAFYEFPRAGGKVTGSTIHLAKTLAQAWGNIQYGVSEMRRDDQYRQSEMQAWAWDVEANTRHVLTFVVPHAKFAGGKVQALIDLRDIYENNANNGARRLREAIFAVIPDFFIDEAEDLCRETLNKGDGKPIEDRIAGAIGVFKSFGVTEEQLEQKLGRKKQQWTGADIAQLLITHKSIDRREITVAEAFPQARITGGEIKANGAGRKASSTPPDDDPWAGQAVAQPGSKGGAA